jgi:hypothetical protein
MALPAALKGPLNPFRLTGTPMPPNLLLMCKVLALALLATSHVRILPDPFLPFFPGLDQLTEPALFKATLQTVAVVAAAALLLNRTPRWCALIVGTCMLLAVVSSRAYYGNNKTFVGLVLVLVGLSDFDRPPYLLRWQLTLVYFGAALNKLLDADWQSGLFFDYWAGEKHKQPVYLAVSSRLPPLLAGKLMCWGTIFAEATAALGLLLPPLVPLALWANVLFQVALLEFTGQTFILFFYAMVAATLAFVRWPAGLQVLQRRQKSPWRWLRWLDPDGVQKWQPADPSTRDGGDSWLLVRQGERLYSGIAAVSRLLLYSPVVWLGATAALALGDAGWWRRLLVASVMLLVLPGFWSRRVRCSPAA